MNLKNLLKDILTNLIRNDMNPSEVAYFLEEIIQAEGDPWMRLLALKILCELNYDNSVFNILENAVISDNSSIIRNYCILYLIKKYPYKAQKAIIWTIKHEKCSFILNNIYDFIRESFKIASYLKNAFKERLLQISENLGIKKSELKLLFELNIEINKIQFYNLNSLKKIHIEKDLCIILKNKSIWALSIHNREIIPNSITRLKNLEFLDLSYNSFREVPLNFEGLKKLKFLDISNTDLEKDNVMKNLPIFLKEVIL